MTFVWLAIWLLSGTPDVEPWNAWLIGLIVCVMLDLLDRS